MLNDGVAGANLTDASLDTAEALLDGLTAAGDVLEAFPVFGTAAIGLCKRWRVVRDVFRDRIEEMHDTVMLLCCGLHNLLLTQEQPLTP